MTQVINQEYLDHLELFGEGLSKRAYIIKYEVITPDLFILCFRTYGQGGNVYYFCLLEFDYMSDIEAVKRNIKDSFSDVIEFLPPLSITPGTTEFDKITAKSDVHSNFVLARTVLPTGVGYWANYITIMPGDTIDEKLASLKPEDKNEARKVVVNILAKYLPETSGGVEKDFLSEWQQKYERSKTAPKDMKINDTRIGMNIYKNKQGAWEAFYNFVKK